MEKNWNNYQNKTVNLKKIDFIIDVLDRIEGSNGLAIDLGCGAGNDSIYMVQNGWNVIAIDSETSVIENRRNELESNMQEKLQILNGKFEEVELPKADLIFANYSIPFCNPMEFEKLWNKIDDSIKSGGIFAGIIFGKHDGWAKRENMTFKAEKDIKEMLKMFTIEVFEEDEYDGITALRKEKALAYIQNNCKKKISGNTINKKYRNLIIVI